MSDSEGELSVTGQKEGKTTSWQLEHTARVGGQIRYSGASVPLPCLMGGQRQRGELVPIGEVVSGMGGPVQALQPSPPARRGFTRFYQVNQLGLARRTPISASWRGCLCSLPRTNPGNRHQYKRVNGPFRLYMQAGPETKLPFGTNPRLYWLGCVPKRYGREAAISF